MCEYASTTLRIHYRECHAGGYSVVLPGQLLHRDRLPAQLGYTPRETIRSWSSSTMRLNENVCTSCEVEHITDELLKGQIRHPLFAWQHGAKSIMLRAGYLKISWGVGRENWLQVG